MKTNDTNTIIPVNYDASMYIRWLATEAMNASQTAKQLFNGYYNATNPAYSSLVMQINTYMEQVETDIAHIKEYMASLPIPTINNDK
jgi:hypothetical protein